MSSQNTSSSDYANQIIRRITEIYRTFPDNMGKIEITMDSETLNIVTPQKWFVLPRASIQRVDYPIYIEDVINADFDYNFGRYAETDLKVLYQVTRSNEEFNGHRILAYSNL